MNAALVAGSEVTVIGVTSTGARRFRAVVADILQDSIVLDAAGDEVVMSGSAASFLHDGRVFDCSVVRGNGSRISISRPDDLAADDRRGSRRIATSLPASFRKAHLRGEVAAAHVIDLSLTGARLLTETLDDGLDIDHQVDLRMGSIVALAWVRHTQPHENQRLRYVGVEFAPLDDRSRRHLLDTVGSIRTGMHRWR